VGDSVTRLLGDDHRRLDQRFAEAKRALAGGDAAGAARAFAEFRAGLERHIALEEQVLFPIFERLTGTAGGGPTHVMRVEHTEMKKLMAEISSALERGSAAAELTSPFAYLTARLQAHNGKEERILYPAADHAAGEAGELDGLLVALQTR